jgi:hypothetical protein
MRYGKQGRIQKGPDNRPLSVRGPSGEATDRFTTGLGFQADDRGNQGGPARTVAGQP